MRGIAPPLLALTLAACGAAPSGPEHAALELFRAAGTRPFPAERIDALFDLRVDDPRHAALLDALDRLRVAGEPAVTGIQTLEDLQRTAVDLESRLVGGGVASYTVQLEPAGDDWIVRWFGGPGVEWPPPRRPRDEGLSSSAPPTLPAAEPGRAANDPG